MHILDLAVADNLAPKKVASTNGGEYHSPCPGCGGKDRFIIWDKLNRYYCRRCERRGDPIQYMRDFHAMSYAEACKQLEISPKTPSQTQLWKPQPSFTPHVATMPELEWKQQVSAFITRCHKTLLATPAALELLYERGFTLGTIQDFQLGWNPQTLYLVSSSNKKTWFPRGIVIPTFDAQLQEPLKLKIRQQNAHPKYIEISGSQKAPGIYGDPTNKPLLILESELDAMLVQQFAGDICCPIALGGASKRPDKLCHELLRTSPLILFALDVDQAGAAAFHWWRKTYPNIMLWPPPTGKSPGDALKTGINLRRWILDGIRHKI